MQNGGYLMWIRRAGEVESESGRGGKRERARWKRRVSEMEKENG
jgi:hypothetical protein